MKRHWLAGGVLKPFDKGVVRGNPMRPTLQKVLREINAKTIKSNIAVGVVN